MVTAVTYWFRKDTALIGLAYGLKAERNPLNNLTIEKIVIWQAANCYHGFFPIENTFKLGGAKI